MTAVFVLRHPQTTWNQQGRYQGRLDAPLSREGKSQAELVARAFACESIDAVVSSPLRRAMVLARDIAVAADAPLRTDSRLTEVGQCPWEGLLVGTIRERYPELWGEWRSNPDRVHFPSGECLRDVVRRSVSALADITALYPGGNVVAVTHSTVVQALAAHCLHLDLRYIHSVPAENASVTTICTCEPEWKILSLNVTNYVYRSPVAAAHGC